MNSLSSQPRLVAIGNAPIDFVAAVENSFIDKYELCKGACTTIDLHTADKFKAILDFVTIEPGGGAANVSCFFSALGEKSAFIGKVAPDKHGDLFIKSMEDQDVLFSTQPAQNSLETAQIFVLTTDDCERTFAAYYGEAESISPDDLDRDLIIKSELTYLDCFTLNFKHGYKTLLEAANTAKSSDRLVALNTNDPSMVKNHKAQIHELLIATDILICNEAEALLLSDKSSIEDAIKLLRKTIAYGALTMGENGAYIFTSKEILKIPAQETLGPIANSNGAGDAFAAGFCLGILNDLPIDKLGRLSSICASKTLMSNSPRPQSVLKDVLEQL